MTVAPLARPADGSPFIAWLAIGIVATLVTGLLIADRGKLFGILLPRQTAEFACPAAGTVYTLSMPLSRSLDPVFNTPVKILGHQGLDCHILSQAAGEYWLHAALTADDQQLQWRAAAEELWPLKVGNRSHAHFQARDGATWAVDYEVAGFEKYTARIGTYKAFKIVGTLKIDGVLIYTTTNWWSPSLKYTLGYRLVRRTPGDRDLYWEIAEIGGSDS